MVPPLVFLQLVDIISSCLFSFIRLIPDEQDVENMLFLTRRYYCKYKHLLYVALERPKTKLIFFYYEVIMKKKIGCLLLLCFLLRNSGFNLIGAICESLGYQHKGNESDFNKMFLSILTTYLLWPNYIRKLFQILIIFSHIAIHIIDIEPFHHFTGIMEHTRKTKDIIILSLSLAWGMTAEPIEFTSGDERDLRGVRAQYNQMMFPFSYSFIQTDAYLSRSWPDVEIPVYRMSLQQDGSYRVVEGSFTSLEEAQFFTNNENFPTWEMDEIQNYLEEEFPTTYFCTECNVYHDYEELETEEDSDEDN